MTHKSKKTHYQLGNTSCHFFYGYFVYCIANTDVN